MEPVVARPRDQTHIHHHIVLIMGGVLSSIPLCSRAKIEATEAGGPEAPEERGQTEVTPATVMSQPQSTVIQQQVSITRLIDILS